MTDLWQPIPFSGLDETRGLELLHKGANPGPRGSYHFRQNCMVDSRSLGLWRGLRVVLGEPQEYARQSLVAEIAPLIDQILPVLYVPGQ